jgi:hypothetical protein
MRLATAERDSEWIMSTRLLRIEMDAGEAMNAIASPATQRFVASGVVDRVVGSARARLLELVDADSYRMDAGEQLLASWLEQLLELETPLGPEDRPAGERWLAIGGTALALSAIAGIAGARSTATVGVDGVILARPGAVLSHALGVLHRPGELQRLLAGPLDELEAYRARVGELFWAAEAAVALADDDDTENVAALRREVEETAALAAAAAAVLATSTPHSPLDARAAKRAPVAVTRRGLRGGS